MSPPHPLPTVGDVRNVIHRLFVGAADATLRKEDEQKSREVAALVARLAKLRKGAHLVDAAAGKASVGLVAAELLPVGRLTVLERDPARVEACRLASGRLGRALPVDVREGDVADRSCWPEGYDAVVALHACGPASDHVIDQAMVDRSRQIFVVPCCYGEALSFFARADAKVTALGFVSDARIRERMRSALIDLERKLRMEAAGYETQLIAFVGATVTPHNLLFHGRRTDDAVRIERARRELAALREG